MLNLKTIFSRESPKFDLIIKKIYEQKTKKLKTNINIRAKDTSEKHLTIKILTKVFIFIFLEKEMVFIWNNGRIYCIAAQIVRTV